MKILKAALVIAVLAPALALAQEAAPAPAPTPAETPAPPQGPAATGPTAGPTASTSASASATGALAALEEKENQGGFSLGVELDHSVGTGTFVNPNLYSYFGATLAVTPRYVFTAGDIKLAASLALRGAWEYTLPDSENGRRFSPGDTRLGISAPALLKNDFTGISISPSIGILIPTSPEAWQAGLITNLSAGLAITRPAGRFNFALTGSGSRGFHTSSFSQVRARSGSAEQLQTFSARKSATGAPEAFVASFGTNTAWSFNVGGNVSLQANDELSFVVGYTYSRSWKYKLAPLGPDERLPNGADADLQGEAERTSTVIAANYQLTDHFGVSLSASTLQTPRSGAGGGAGYFRFPFWAIGNAADNATSINFTFSAAY